MDIRIEVQDVVQHEIVIISAAVHVRGVEAGPQVYREQPWQQTAGRPCLISGKRLMNSRTVTMSSMIEDLQKVRDDIDGVVDALAEDRLEDGIGLSC